MKTTVEISDALFERAKSYAKEEGKTMRAIVEDGLREVLRRKEKSSTFELPDLAFGDADDTDPLEALSWQDLRREIYGDPPPE